MIPLAFSTNAFKKNTLAEAIDAIAFGRLFIANPDLVERIRGDFPLNAFDRSTFYGGADHGYTDYTVIGDAA